MQGPAHDSGVAPPVEGGGGMPQPPPVITGSYQGATFLAQGGGISRRNWQGPGGLADVHAGVSILVTPNADPCDTARDTTHPALSFYLRSTAASLAPGAFPIVDSYDGGSAGPAPDATLRLVRFHPSDCNVDVLDRATSGGVTLTVVDGNHIEGTFHASFAQSGTFAGSFSIDDCRDIMTGDYLDETIGCVL
jgi:hypothetical protein